MLCHTKISQYSAKFVNDGFIKYALVTNRPTAGFVMIAQPKQYMTWMNETIETMNAMHAVKNERHAYNEQLQLAMYIILNQWWSEIAKTSAYSYNIVDQWQQVHWQNMFQNSEILGPSYGSLYMDARFSYSFSFKDIVPSHLHNTRTAWWYF